MLIYSRPVICGVDALISAEALSDGVFLPHQQADVCILSTATKQLRLIPSEHLHEDRPVNVNQVIISVSFNFSA